MKPKAEREAWLVQWIKEHQRADILDTEFSDAYILAVGSKFKPTMWGAHKVPLLGKDLSRLASCGIFNRFRIGLGANWQPGWPRWVWSYEIADKFESQSTVNNQPKENS